jgi:hypothetical protein
VAISIALRVFCSTTTTVTPASCRPRISRKTSAMTAGARPIVGSSSSSSRGARTIAIAISSICCSPPERLPASSSARAASTGNIARARAIPAGTSAGAVACSAIWRFSVTLMSGKLQRPCGT